MSYSIIIHILNSEPIQGEIDQLPGPNDLLITVNNPRRTDGKSLTFLLDRVTTVIWPIDRINFIEVLPTEEESDIIGFVRE